MPFLLWLLPLIGFALVWLIYLTCAKRYRGLKQLENDDKPIIVVFWHEHILMMPFLWKRLRKNKPNAKVFALVSDHSDGEMITRTVARLGIATVRGSSTRGGVKAMLSIIKELANGNDVAFTPDGPLGPRHNVAEGVVMAAKKSKSALLPMSYKASRCWRLKSWDRFIIPKPFSTLTFTAGELINLERSEKENDKQQIKEALCRIAA
ncbi:MAG: lysophospholipid acyltransferase family protein [Helicobacteraceae bacterium]|jgi:lysophospholipid acyltransferase (LPLAT)-like uncharacterized protein|nr:lysophospholipid acyltransferase family protein [Helicobacteraceae bacterium]